MLKLKGLETRDFEFADAVFKLRTLPGIMVMDLLGDGDLKISSSLATMIMHECVVDWSGVIVNDEEIDFSNDALFLLDYKTITAIVTNVFEDTF